MNKKEGLQSSEKDILSQSGEKGMCPSEMKIEQIVNYASMTAEEKETFYKAIYEPGYIDDMFDQNYIPIPFRELESEAAVIFDMFKDRPLHPADKEQYPLSLELSKYVESITVKDFPKQDVIKPLLLKGRILEYLDEKKREASSPYELSKGEDYFFIQKYAYHILMKFELIFRPFKREFLPLFEKALEREAKRYLMNFAVVLADIGKYRSPSEREKKLLSLMLSPTIHERDGVEGHIKWYKRGEDAKASAKAEDEEEDL
jgi:hypothetical protein